MACRVEEIHRSVAILKSSTDGHIPFQRDSSIVAKPHHVGRNLSSFVVEGLEVIHGSRMNREKEPGRKVIFLGNGDVLLVKKEKASRILPEIQNRE